MSNNSQRLLTNFFASPSAKQRRKTLFDVSPLTDMATPPKQKRLSDSSTKQMILDAGQRQIGAEPCDTCGMVYSIHDASDVSAHEKYHNRLTDISQFRVYTTMINPAIKFSVFSTHDRYVIRLKSELKIALKLFTEKLIEAVVNESLGFSSDLSIWGSSDDRTVYTCVFHDGKAYHVAGILITELISTAAWNDTGVEFRSKQPMLGVNRIWTHSKLRRRHVARDMLEAARRSQACHEIAFSEPTDLAKSLARSMSSDENKDFLTYILERE